MTTTAPGPRGWQLFKTLMHLRSEPFAVLESMQAKYGDFVGVNVLGRSIIVLSHPKYAQHILKDNFKNYLRRGQDFEEVRPLIGNGLLLAEGEVWRQQRRTLSREFHKDSVEKFIPDIINSTEIAIANWLDSAKPSIDMYNQFMHLALEIAGLLFLGTHIDEAEIFHDAIEFNGRLAEARIRSGIRVPRGCPLPSHVKAAKKIKAMDKIIYNIISDYQKNPSARKNVLSRLIEANTKDSSFSMSDRQLRDEVVTMLLAGHETTASTLSWVFYNLAKYPQWQDELFQEVTEVLGDGPISFDSLSNLVKVKAFIQESLRLFPTVANMDRHAIDSDVLEGYEIKKDTTVNLSIYLLHRHPDFWQEPETFDPTRFIGIRLEQIHPYAFLPFGKGPRSCIGELLATVESQIIVAMVVKKMTISLQNNEPIKIVPRITIVPGGGLPLILKQR